MQAVSFLENAIKTFTSFIQITLYFYKKNNPFKVIFVSNTLFFALK